MNLYNVPGNNFCSWQDISHSIRPHRRTVRYGIIVVEIVNGFNGLIIDDGHLGGAVHEDDVVALVLLRGLVEEFLVQEVSGGTGSGGSSETGGGVSLPVSVVGRNFVPSGSVAPDDGVLVLDGSLDFPVSGGVDKANGVFFLGIVLVRVFGLDGVGTGGFFSARESVDGDVSLLVVHDIQLADFFAVIGELPFSAPSLGSLLGLLLVVDVHSSDTHGGSGKCANEGPGRAARLGSLDFAHGRLDFVVLDGIDEIEGFSVGCTLGLDVVVEVAQVISGSIVVTHLEEGNGEWAGFHFIGDFVDRVRQCGVEIVGIVGFAGGEDQNSDGSIG